MALIPIVFKADGGDVVPQKGKIRAEDFSALAAFSLGKKTGVLDLLGKASANPNITISGGTATFTLQSGYIAICGRLVYIEDATEVSITLPTRAGNGSFGVKVNLTSTGQYECAFYSKMVFDQNYTPTLTTDDLNENPSSGVYEFELYKYTATADTFAFSQKTTEVIEPNSALLERVDEEIESQLEEINERLDGLGFKQATVTVIASGYLDASNTDIRSLGKVLYGKMRFSVPQNWTSTTTANIGRISNVLLPSRDMLLKQYTSVNTQGSNVQTLSVYLNRFGYIILDFVVSGAGGIANRLAGTYDILFCDDEYQGGFWGADDAVYTA